MHRFFFVNFFFPLHPYLLIMNELASLHALFLDGKKVKRLCMDHGWWYSMCIAVKRVRKMTSQKSSWGSIIQSKQRKKKKKVNLMVVIMSTLSLISTSYNCLHSLHYYYYYYNYWCKKKFYLHFYNQNLKLKNLLYDRDHKMKEKETSPIKFLCHSNQKINM